MVKEKKREQRKNENKSNNRGKEKGREGYLKRGENKVRKMKERKWKNENYEKL